MSTIKLSIAQGVARLTINRAEKYNALSQDMWQQVILCCEQLQQAVKDAENPNQAIHVLVISAEGEKAFCTGADIAELAEIIKDEHKMVANNRLVQEAQRAIEALPFATIAQINGLCFGGGMGLALSCDFRIAAAHASFSIPPAKLGLLYSVEDTQRVVNAIGLPRAKEMLMTGKKVDATTALHWGLVNDVVDIAALADKVNELVILLQGASAQSITGIKQTLAYITRNEGEPSHVGALFEQAFSSEDFKEGALAFLEKRVPNFGVNNQ